MAQLWFQPHLCMWATFRLCSLPRWEGGEDNYWLGHVSLLRLGGAIGGNRGGMCACSGQKGISLQWLRHMCSFWWDPPLAPAVAGVGRRWWPTMAYMLAQAWRGQGGKDWGMRACSGGSPTQCLRRQGLVCGERSCDGGPAPHAPLNNGTLLPWQSAIPPGAFPAADLLTLVPSVCLWAVEFLTPIPSGHLCAANSSPLPRFTLQTPRFSTQPLSALVDTILRLEHAGLWNRPSVQDSLRPACHRPTAVLSSDSPWSPTSIRADLATSEGASLGVTISPLLQLLPQGVWVPSHVLFSFPSFSLFHHTQLRGDILSSF